MITILGATGNVGGKIARSLMNSGEKLRLVARSADRLRPLVGRRVEAMAGDLLDTEFLVQAFQGSGAVFVLIPPNSKADSYLAYADKAGASIARALELGRIRHVVNLSSIGAELSEGTGPIAALHNQEERLNRIPGLNVLHVRAAFFMENLLAGIDLIKTKGINGSAVRGDIKMPMIASRDIASFAGERLLNRDFGGSSVRYLLGSNDISMNEATMTIGIKIGKPNLPYITFSPKEALNGLAEAGFSKDMSRLYVEMSKGFNEGRIAVKRTQEATTPTSFNDFCEEVFVPFYMEKKAA